MSFILRSKLVSLLDREEDVDHDDDEEPWLWSNKELMKLRKESELEPQICLYCWVRGRVGRRVKLIVILRSFWRCWSIGNVACP